MKLTGFPSPLSGLRVPDMTSGKGVFIETSMFEGLVGYTLIEHQYGAIFDPPFSGPGYSRMLSRNRRPY